MHEITMRVPEAFDDFIQMFAKDFGYQFTEIDDEIRTWFLVHIITTYLDHLTVNPTVMHRITQNFEALYEKDSPKIMAIKKRDREEP